MTNHSLELEIDKVARQLADVDAKLQIALDTLITTESIPHYDPAIQIQQPRQGIYQESRGKNKDFQTSAIGVPSKENNQDESENVTEDNIKDNYITREKELDAGDVLSLDYCNNISSTKNKLSVYDRPCTRRSPASNITIIKINASKQQLSIPPTIHCSSLVRIGTSREHAKGEEDNDDEKPCRNAVAQVTSTRLSGVSDSYRVITSNLASLKNQTRQPIMTKIVKRSQSVVSSNREQAEVFQLKQHCRSLEGELDGVKSEIIRILSEKDGVLRENQILKNLQTENKTLKEENRKLRKKYKQMVDDNSPKRSAYSSDEGFELEIPARSSPDGEELNKIGMH